MWWFWIGWAFGACPDAPTEAAMASASTILRAFEEVEEALLREAQADLDIAVPCIRDPLDAGHAVILHRAYAVVHFVEADAAASRRSWRAARRLTPAWVPTEAFAPTGHPLRTLFDEAEPTDRRVAIESAPPGGWRVDGSPDTTVPEDAAFVLQGLDADGAVVLTGYFPSPVAIPPADVRALAALPRVPASTRRVRRWGTVVAGAAFAAGTGLMVAGRVDHQNAQGAGYDDVEGLRRRGWTRIGAGAVTTGVALVGGAVVWTGRW